MNLKSIGSKVQTATQTATQAVQQPKTVKTVDAFRAATTPKVALRVDHATGFDASAHLGDMKLASFTVGPAGIRLSNGNANLDCSGNKGMGASTHVAGRELGVHFKVADGPATLGAVDVELAGHELVLGLVPAAPAPLPLIVYAGKDRDGEG